MKEAIQDMLEQTHADIWDGLSKKDLKLVKQTEQGKAYIELCKEYEDKINNGLSKLKQA